MTGAAALDIGDLRGGCIPMVNVGNEALAFREKRLEGQKDFLARRKARHDAAIAEFDQAMDALAEDSQKMHDVACALQGSLSLSLSLSLSGRAFSLTSLPRFDFSFVSLSRLSHKCPSLPSFPLLGIAPSTTSEECPLLRTASGKWKQRRTE